MVRSIIYILVSLILLGTAVTFEQIHLNKEFSSFCSKLEYSKSIIEEKNDEKLISSLEDTKTWWEKQKRILHIYIPHNEIRDVDRYLTEAISHAKNKDSTLAGVQIDILINISFHLPDSFGIKIENIF